VAIAKHQYRQRFSLGTVSQRRAVRDKAPAFPCSCITGAHVRAPLFCSNQETPGEDPLTNGEYAAQLAHGMQGTDPNWLQISACAKHFAVHSWNTPSTYMAYPTKQDLADTYLPGMIMMAVEMKRFADNHDRANIFSTWFASI
jgi:hypothetical protein